MRFRGHGSGFRVQRFGSMHWTLFLVRSHPGSEFRLEGLDVLAVGLLPDQKYLRVHVRILWRETFL